MMHLTRKKDTPKGWFVGPWNSEVPIPIGYANAGVNESHYHSEMYEVYLVAQGQSTAVVDGRRVELKAGDILVIEPGEVHTFVNSTEDYLHFVVHTSFVEGDKHLIKDESTCGVEGERQAREQAWSKLSPAGAPDRLLYLDTLSAAEFAQAYKRQSFELLDVQEGDWVLDVGCGPGDDVRLLAQRVGRAGRVVGVDNDAAMVGEAYRRGADKTLPVAFHLCDVHHLAFDEDVFDRCRADRVFQHLEDPRQALAEIVRVARPGVRIVVIEPDWKRW
jgi:2-polyprenyl-3-methyl-5-hydroxy-6-metoxy-1,4-benzoquinol methylase